MSGESYNRGHAGRGARIRKKGDVPRNGSIPLTDKKDREWRCHFCHVLCDTQATLQAHEKFCEVKKDE